MVAALGSFQVSPMKRRSSVELGCFWPSAKDKPSLSKMLDNVVVIRPWQGLWQAFLPVLGSFRRASATLPIAIICVRARARAQYQYPSCSRGSCIYRLVLPQSTRPLRFIAPPESYRARRKLSRPHKVIAPSESYRVP